MHTIFPYFDLLEFYWHEQPVSLPLVPQAVPLLCLALREDVAGCRFVEPSTIVYLRSPQKTEFIKKHIFQGFMLRNPICFKLLGRLTSETDCRITILMFRILQPLIYETSNHLQDVRASGNNNVFARKCWSLFNLYISDRFFDIYILDQNEKRNLKSYQP